MLSLFQVQEKLENKWLYAFEIWTSISQFQRVHYKRVLKEET